MHFSVSSLKYEIGKPLASCGSLNHSPVGILKFKSNPFKTISICLAEIVLQATADCFIRSTQSFGNGQCHSPSHHLASLLSYTIVSNRLVMRSNICALIFTFGLATDIGIITDLCPPRILLLRACFRVTHPPFCRMSSPDLVPLCCLLLTCERFRCLHLVRAFCTSC